MKTKPLKQDIFFCDDLLVIIRSNAMKRRWFGPDNILD